jgi:hypothetical protein
MSLPTPPRTSHRDKENRPVFPVSRVAWSGNDQVHLLEDLDLLLMASDVLSVHSPPRKSILKKPSQPLLPLTPSEEREVTPEPESPSSNSTYLQSCVSTIIHDNGKLKDTIQAYGTLAARLRQCASEEAHPQHSWPLFDPIRSNIDSFADAINRHLESALTDPAPGEQKDRAAASLPSPRSSPKKKKGMSGETVKYARDMSTLCLSTMRLLGVMLVLPEIVKLFTGTYIFISLGE